MLIIQLIGKYQEAEDN